MPRRLPLRNHARTYPLLLASALAACGASAGVPEPENLLFLCVDTLRADQLGAYGDTPSITPAIDALGAEGIVYENALSHASWTLPSFASVLTSQYTSTHGCWTFETPLAPSFATLPELFSEAGFETFGIASHVFFNEKYGLQQGFDDFDDELAHKLGEEGWMKVTSPRVTEKAVRWIDARAGMGGRWLLWLHYFDPHIPYVDHERTSGPTTKSEFERYRSEIAHTDTYVGQVLEALERNGFAERTAVVFLSDHGESFFEHPGVFRHARSLFREELRVPLVLRIPGVEPRRVEEIVRTVDLLPTLLEVFRIEPGRVLPMEGQSLVPTFLGRAPEPRPLLAQIDLHEDGHHVRSLVSGSWKLIEGRTGAFQLYDLAADADERVDVSRLQPDKVRALRAEMESLIERAEALRELYSEGGPIEHSPEELEHLRAMGYVGGDDGSED